jgi:hypothetical protein
MAPTRSEAPGTSPRADRSGDVRSADGDAAMKFLGRLFLCLLMALTLLKAALS